MRKVYLEFKAEPKENKSTLLFIDQISEVTSNPNGGVTVVCGGRVHHFCNLSYAQMVQNICDAVKMA